ncbi:MAG: hypothetical protein ABSH08_11250 [Tepidisphaeraceae bacterium]
MKLLFDHNVDRRFRRYIPGHEIRTTREMGWEALSNGLLLKVAADARFEAFVSIDKKIEREQNLKILPLPVVIIDALSNALPALIPFSPLLLDLFSHPLEPLLYVVEPTGLVHRLTAPRK